MAEILLLAGFAGIGALLLGIEWQRYRLDATSARMFSEALASAGREYGIERWRMRGRRRATADAKGFSIDVALRSEAVRRQEFGQSHTELVEFLVVRVTGERIPRGVRFGAESGAGDDVLTGDPSFDDTVEVQGEPAVLLALLNESVRGKLRRLVGGGGALESGTLSWHEPVHLIETEVRAAIRIVVSLAQELSTADGGGVCERLARNAEHDPVGGVRLWNLLLLQERFGVTAQAREASSTGLQDANPWVRLSAARFLGEEGLSVVEQLARDKTAPPQAAAEAAALLASRLPVERVGPLLLTLLKTRTGEVQHQAVEQLGRLGYQPALGALIVLLEHAADRTAIAAATALGSLEGPQTESALLGVIRRDDHELQIASARALGRAAGIRAVAPLLALLETEQLDPEVASSVREAVAAIQSRLAGAGAGQLSLAPSADEDGRLSLAQAPDEAGRVSLKDTLADD